MGPHLHLISFFPVSQFEQLIAKHYCGYMIPLVTQNWCNVKGDETNGASRKYATMAKLQKSANEIISNIANECKNIVHQRVLPFEMFPATECHLVVRSESISKHNWPILHRVMMVTMMMMMIMVMMMMTIIRRRRSSRLTPKLFHKLFTLCCQSAL